MRTKIDKYKITIENDYIIVHIKQPIGVTIGESLANVVSEALRLVIDETAREVFCSSMQKAKIASIVPSDENGYDIAIAFDIPVGKTIATTDQFTIEADWGTSAEEIKEALDSIIESLAVRHSTGIVVENVVFTTKTVGEALGRALVEQEINN